ncbi:hypothetical protein JW979_12620, partial [bacterium]|nr:hypothetical protein [candidate division CSSED10-310 bacterium]
MNFQFDIVFFQNGETISTAVSVDNQWICDDCSVWSPKLKLGFSWTFDSGTLRIPVASLREEGDCFFKQIIPNTGFIKTNEGQDESLLIPHGCGVLCRTQNKKPGEYIIPVFREPLEPTFCNMSIYARLRRNKVRAEIIEDGKFDAYLRLRTNWGVDGEYSISPVYSIRDYEDEPLPIEDLSLVQVELNGGLSDLAKFYREYNRETHQIPSLAERAAKNPVLDYSARAITVRLRTGVKPLPCQIPSQTPENEPSIGQVFMKFEDIRMVIDEFSRQNVGPTEFCIVGWNHGGHDGAFPQLFPVEEAFGGEIELKKTIEHAKKAGYPLSGHDNFYDGFTRAENLDPKDLLVTHGGSPFPWGILAGGLAFRVCPQRALEKYAPENMKKTSELGMTGAYFSDVISLIYLLKCYSKEHPGTRRDNAERYRGILRLQHRIFGASMSEGAREWALPELDRAFMIYEAYKPSVQYIDEIVPFYQLVYHGLLIYNNCRGVINALPGEEEYLTNLAWGGMPLIYFHQLFDPGHFAAQKKTDNKKISWSKDITFDTPEKLTKDVAIIKKISDDVEKLSVVRYAFMENFIRHSKTLTETIYNNGYSVWVNYSNEEVTVSMHRIPPKEIAVIRNKLMKNNNKSEQLTS